MFSLGDDSDFFMVRMDPCVMIILDSSGSMTWDMEGTPTCGDGSEEYPGRDTDIDEDTIPDDSRLYIAKEALRHLVTSNTDFQFGLMTYGQVYEWTDLWYYDGTYYANSYWPYWCGCYPWWNCTEYIWWWGLYWPNEYPDTEHNPLRVDIGPNTPEHRDSIIAWIDNNCGYPDVTQGDYEIRACGGTPIGGALYWARRYYESQIIPYDSARACRRYFVVLVSDGEETGYPDYNDHNPYTEADNLRHTTVGGETYDIQTYVIGIAITGGTGATCLDSIAKLGGTDHYYPALNVEQLDSAFASILGSIETRAFSFSAPEVPAVRSKYYDKLYIASFVPSYDVFWRGYLKAYQLAPGGILPVDEEGEPANPPLWEAGQALKSKSSSSRRIYTEMNGELVPFISSNIPAETLGVDADDVDSLINWVRGDNEKGWKLGDIFHSQPVVVGPPCAICYDEGYGEFSETHKDRKMVVFVGANDGMLHAFDAGTYVAEHDSFTVGTGAELWAYIPHDLLHRLKEMRNLHNYYVDGSPQAADVWFPESEFDTTKEADEWRTVLICGERQGGNHYFALDITDTENPTFLWSFTDELLGETWSKPAIGKIKIKVGNKVVERWVAVIGGGFNKEPVSESVVGKSLYILDIRNGEIIWRFSYTDGGSHREFMKYAIPSEPTLADIDGDGYVERIYVGDLGGQLFRIDISSPNINHWHSARKRIFNVGETQPIYYPPVVAFDDQWQLWLFFGTGDRDNPRDFTSQNRFYAIVDKGQSCAIDENDLGDVTLGGSPTDKGWYINFVEQEGNHDGEKVLSTCEVFGGIVYFTTYQPINTGDPCATQGIARLYRVNYKNGAAIEEVRYEEIGSSLPTAPQISVSTEGNFVITISTSAQKIISERVETPASFKRMVYWRELY